MGNNKSAGREVTVRVFRSAPDADLGPWREDFSITVRRGMTILDALDEINSTHKAAIAFRSSCRAGRCGSCAMRINGRPRLACRTQLSSLRGRVITVEPLRNFPVLRDLVVSMDDFWRKYAEVRPWIQSDSVFMRGEVAQSPADLQRITTYVACKLCGACYSECPAARRRKSFLGPAALVHACRFIEDSRDNDTEERLSIVNSHAGVWGCRSDRVCTRVCPAGVLPTDAVAALRRRLLLRPVRALSRRAR